MAPEPPCVMYLSRPSSPETTLPSSKTPTRRRRCRKRSRQENVSFSSTYYVTSVSKAKILNMVQEKIAKGDEEYLQDTAENINQKTVELILSIKSKLNDLLNMKTVLDAELRENENLGRQVHGLVAKVCNPREEKKYNLFVQDVDKIINLLLSLSGRLTRVENAIQMLPADANKAEKEYLCQKQKSLTEQLREAMQLKENIDRRQTAVSKILNGYFNTEQFADFEHYIKMKNALILEQRELSDNVRLGEEQMQCLQESLPKEWQITVENMIDGEK